MGLIHKPEYISWLEQQHIHQVVIEGPTEIEYPIYLWEFSKIRKNCRIGSDVSIGQCCYIDEGVTIGKGCRIQNGVSIYKCVTLEDEVFMGPNSTVLNDINPRAGYSKGGDLSKYKPTLIKKGASIGGNATILPGITIGEYAIVGAGSVVVRDVSNHQIVVGNPAHLIGAVCYCGEHRWIYNKLNPEDKLPEPWTVSCEICGYSTRMIPLSRPVERRI